MTTSDPKSPPRAARGPNHLIHEKSPYLLQHAHNPVDWHPWGEEAFGRARREDRPILLSIGYSTCHWCHVMERETFADESVAALLDPWFVAIKVDREERPDVDRLYMTAAQAMGLGGGWPLNLFLTPALEPFYGGTYFPPEPRHGRPSFKQVLVSVHQAWSEARERVEESGRRVIAALADLALPDSAAVGREEMFAEALRHFEESFDAREGGFGGAPRFPSVANLDFLLRVGSRGPRSPESAAAAAPEGPPAGALEMALRQLDAMRAGGIHDVLGGGFHRYATDARWRVPHFEKMLYDQAQIACAYLDAWRITARPEYAETARGILGYVERDLVSGSPAGGGAGEPGAFCSAEDADSEGEEGRYYVWTPTQTAAELGVEDGALFDFVHDVTPTGNSADGASVLRLAHTDEEAAQRFALPLDEARRRLAAARARLLQARGRRVRPLRDDKVLTAWNGLAISAFAQGARALEEPALAACATRAAEFVWAHLRVPESGELRRRWCAGEAAGAGQLADHADYALGLVDLYQATHEPKWLERAVLVTDAMVARFRDDEHGAFFESPAGDATLRVRMKDGFDGAEIAGNSIAAHVLQLLGGLLGRRDWLECAERTFEYYRRRLAGHAAAMPRMLVAMDLAAVPPRHVVIAGDPAAGDTRALIREFDRRFLPRDLLLVVDGGERGRRLADLAPFLGALTARGGRATAYVCVDYACRLPVTDPREFAAQLDS